MKNLKKDIDLFDVEDNTPEVIRAVRDLAGHTQLEAAEELYLTHRNTWGKKESGERSMSAAEFELYLLKTDQHKKFKLVKR